MSTLFREYGVCISAIVGGTYFDKPSGEKVGVEKCACFFGNFEGQKKGDITFRFINYPTKYSKDIEIELQDEIDEENSVVDYVDSDLSSTTSSSSSESVTFEPINLSKRMELGKSFILLVVLRF